MSIVVAGPDRASLREVALRSPWTTRSVIDLADSDRLPAGHPAHAQAMAAGRAAAFVCRDATCSLPVFTADALGERLAELSRA
jgi:uncharacterized protein YyaL (SSP411 family)